MKKDVNININKALSYSIVNLLFSHFLKKNNVYYYNGCS